MKNRLDLILSDKLVHAPNEIYNVHAINDKLKNLLQNDIKLAEKFNSLLNKIDGITEFIAGQTYKKGQIVWYSDEAEDGNIMLYLLESIIDDNANIPKLIQLDGLMSFESTGWKDLNPYMTIKHNDLSSYSLNIFVNQLDSEHSLDEDYHKLGIIEETNVLDNTKLLKTDISNLDVNRTNVFFPYESVPLEPDNVIRSGFYRKWDNGLLEYDIIFKLSYIGNMSIGGADYDVLSCNNLILHDNSTNVEALDYNENGKYFNSTDDMDIFGIGCIQLSSKIEGMLQINRNAYSNTYSAKIVLPEPFKDINYSTFTTNVRCQERNTKKQSIDASSNAMTFTDKTRQSIVALLIVYPENGNENGEKDGLLTNSFHCQLVGRWK